LLKARLIRLALAFRVGSYLLIPQLGPVPSEAMARSAIQCQRGLSLSEFQRLYGSEEKCEVALENAGWYRLLGSPPKAPPSPSHPAGP
jgi:hypothetical protein